MCRSANVAGQKNTNWIISLVLQISNAVTEHASASAAKATLSERSCFTMSCSDDHCIWGTRRLFALWVIAVFLQCLECSVSCCYQRLYQWWFLECWTRGGRFLGNKSVGLAEWSICDEWTHLCCLIEKSPLTWWSFYRICGWLAAAAQRLFLLAVLLGQWPPLTPGSFFLFSFVLAFSLIDCTLL